MSDYESMFNEVERVLERKLTPDERKLLLMADKIFARDQPRKGNLLNPQEPNRDVA